MTDKWQDLPDLQSVAKAQAEGWEIEIRVGTQKWDRWQGTRWDCRVDFRGRPAQPKVKTVTSKCWRDKDNGSLIWRNDEPSWAVDFPWQRFPAGDLTGEVCDD
jgi:hypothetical protein